MWGRLAARWLPFALWLGLFGFVPYAGRFPTGDSPHILGICMRLGSYLRSGEVWTFLSRWLELLAPHPPGAYLLPAVAYGIFGNRYWVPWVCGAILLAVIWNGILRMLDSMEIGGAWGVALALVAAPLIWSQAENYGIDLASAAAVVQCLSFLMVSRGLSDRHASLLAGLWLGLGFWTKYTFPVFLFVPSLAVIAGLAWDRVRSREGLGSRVRNGGILAAAFGVVILPLVVLRGQDIAHYVLRSLAPREEERMLVDALSAPGALDISSFDRKYLYLAALKDLWGWPGMVLLGLGFLVLVVTGVRTVWRKQERSVGALRAAVLGLLAPVSGVLFLSSFAQKADRYMLPALFPLVAVLVPPLASRRWTAPLVLAVLLPPAVFVFSDYAGYTQHLAFDQGVRSVDLQFRHRGPAPTARRLDHSAKRTLWHWGRYPLLEEPYRPYSANPGHWKIDTLLTWVKELDPTGQAPIGVYIAPSLPATHLGMLLMRSERLGYHRTLVTVKLRPDKNGDLHVDLFQAPFITSEHPTFDILVVMDTRDTGGANLLEQYVKREGFSVFRSEDLGHGRVRVLKRRGRAEG